MAPPSRFENRAKTGTRVPRNTQAPLTLSEWRSTAGQAVHSSIGFTSLSQPRDPSASGSLAGWPVKALARCDILRNLPVWLFACGGRPGAAAWTLFRSAWSTRAGSVPRWILAVSQPMAWSRRISSRSWGSAESSIREQSGAGHRAAQLSAVIAPLSGSEGVAFAPLLTARTAW